MQITSELKKSPYFEGRRLPLSDLSASEFEEFVAAALTCIGKALGIEIQGMPSGSGDGGFDVSGKDLRTGRIVCIQCKRQLKSIGIAQVAIELAKVAANSKIEGSDVGQHRFICTGGIANELIRLLRGDFRTTLVADAGNRLAYAKDGELVTLREKLVAIGEDPRLIVKSYVEGLDELIVWDQDGFDVALSSRWNEVLQVVERYFNIATVVREHPRASFNRAAYLLEYDSFKAIIEPRFINAALPSGISVPAILNADIGAKRECQIKNLLDLAELEDGSLVILLGEGGVGKTTTLELIRSKVLQIHPDTALPIYISLANYVPGELSRLIHRELGVDSGTWHSLPDRVVLLCDGLNECPSDSVSHFLNELKIILKRHLAACIITTRETSRHRSVVLPVMPLTCIRVEHLTPTAVRQIAENTLGPGQAKAFEAAFLERANRAHSPHLWTPFSVGVGLECWRLDSALPKTLGEMIDKVIYSRCKKDAETPIQFVGPNVVLKLASALAFNSLITQSRLECAEVEAGKWIRDAKLLCLDALGVADMTELNVIALLKHHNLVHLSSTGYFNFGHQLLIGALAAPILVRNWKDHLRSTGNTLADDAWIFASRLIPSAEVSEFIEEMFRADLILGARAARELPEMFHNAAEQFIFQSIENDSSEILRLNGIVALSELATPGAIAKLRELSSGSKSETTNQAKCALSATGDLDFLRRILPEVESMRAFPGKMSGGDIGIWEAAPYSARLEVARDWLAVCQPGMLVKESILLIAHEQNPNDSALIQRQLVEGMDLAQWSHVLYALNRILPARAVEIFEENLAEAKQPKLRAMLIQIAASIGIPFDLKLAFDCALLDLVGEQPESMVEHELFNLINNVIAKETLLPELIAIVENELASTDNVKTGRLWAIAGCFESATIAAIAETRLNAWGDDLGCVCNYFLKQPQLIIAREKQILNLCEDGFQREKFWHNWHTGRALDLIGAIGFTPKIATILCAMVEQLTRIRIANETGQIASLSLDDLDLIKSSSPEDIKFTLNRFASNLIKTCAKAKHLLSNDTKLALLYFDHTMTAGFDESCDLLRNIASNDIDDVLKEITNAHARLSSLCLACEYGSTTFRINLLAEELAKFIEIPSRLKFLATAIDRCWCPELLQIVIDTVVKTQFRWEIATTWEFAEMVAKKLEPCNKDQIDAALLNVRNDVSKRILKFWRDRAVGTRFGLSRLVTE
ncbi:restriction endonuclease [Undibacterium sp.]|uniref:restriction endonuclease n=1 Tax=Undibacterium sp. TaxID=1914977 RepID=UPI0025CB7D9E|nr:restriction endonuclease [Undibacterium sp.]